MDIEARDQARRSAARLVESLKHGRLDDAESLLGLVEPFYTEDAVLTFRVFILIQRGRALDALHLLNELPEDRCPELRAICLRLLNDPVWHSIAESLVHSEDAFVRKAMRQLTGRPLELDGD